MSEEATAAKLSAKSMISRFSILLAAAALVGFGGTLSGAMTLEQSTACAVFISIIFGTLFFWGFRLAIAFLGLAVLLFNKSLDIPTFVTSSSLEVILFLVGMMVIVGALRDLGFFTWIVQLIVSMPNLSGRKFIFVTATASALLACAVDEVTSIIFIATLIFQVSDRLKLNPTPYILIAVLATVFDTSLVFSKLQDAESGEFSITGLADVNWTLVVAITAVALLVVASLLAIRSVLYKKAK